MTRIKGVGGVTARALARLLPPMTAQQGSGQPLVRDLLFHLPTGLVDRRATYPLRQTPAGVIATFVVTVDEHIPPKQKRFGKQPYKVLCSNETGEITLVFFHARPDYIAGSLPVGSQRVISGKTEHFDYRLQMTHPDIIAPVSQLAEVQKPEPVYPLTVDLTSRRIAKLVDEALEKLPELEEWVEKNPLPQGEGEFWPSFKSALTLAHRPQSEEDLSPLSPARIRLAYDELLANQIHLARLRVNMERQPGEIIPGPGPMETALQAALPYQLTRAQESALADIYADMASGHRMGRLLQGDVGSGKTIVALLAMLRAADRGFQSAFMAPTEIVARQHYETISSLLATCHLPLTTLLTGSVKGVARKEALEKIAGGDAKIVIGTHALFQEKVQFRNLALTVVDEQHRFGVEQRMALSAKGAHPHILHMTATPIPRSLAMTLYGDMDCSLIKEKPAGRQPIITRLIPLARYGDILDRLKSALDRGEKAYWICPLIEDVSEQVDLDIAAAKSRYTEFKARFGSVVGLVHGRMNSDERQAEMQQFAEGKTKLLVATTVVEVGLDVKDATIIVIEQAERFGLSQLHQLRGRVGRGEKPSACVLLYSEEGMGLRAQGIGEDTHALSLKPQARLSILRDTEDGFSIAEEDLRQRGGGDLLGTRQSGHRPFVLADMTHHQALLFAANEEAKSILKTDPELSAPRGAALKILLQLFGYDP